MFDGKAFGEEMVAIVRGFVERETHPLIAQIKALTDRLEQLESREPVSAAPDIAAIREVVAAEVKGLPVPQDGTSVTLEDVAPIIRAAVAEQVAALPAPRDGQDVDLDALERAIGERVEAAVAALPPAQAGKDADPELIEQLVGDHVDRAVAALPVPQDGTSVTLEDVAPVILAAVAERVAALPPAQDGTSVTLEDVEPLIRDVVAEQVAALPPAAAGKDVDMEAVEREIRERVEAAVSALPPPCDGVDADMDVLLRAVGERVEAAVAAIPVAKDGIGLAGALINRDGNLVVTLTNGDHRDLGRVVGTDADMDVLLRRVDEQVAAIPKPRNGFELDNFETKMMPDGRTLELSFTQGDTTYTHELFFPVMLYRDVYKEGEDYQHGDVVTWGGSLWFAQRDTSAKPDGAESGWKLVVKRGRDGKDHTPKAPV